jgi:radical SAM superfamily enzyme YgiQ (UPF0313 family)
MALKILLVSVNRCASPYLVFPLGLSHVAGALARAGHEVKIIDCAADGTDIDSPVREFGPAVIGLSLRNIDDIQIHNTRFFADDLSTLARSLRAVTPEATIVLGGSGYSLFPRELLAATGADFGIKGEGDISFVNLCAALESKEPYQRIPGLVFRDDGVITVNPSGAIDTAAIAPASRPGRLVEFYRSKSTILNVQTQRGCSSACCYCTYPLIEGAAVRRRDAKDVADELEKIRASGCSYFFIVDSVFNSSSSHVRALCEELLRRDLGLSWGCFLKPSGLSQELCDLMAKAGLRHIEFGSDSFCDRVLDEYGKNFTFEDIAHASGCALKAKIHHAHFLITGGPGETEATMREGFENSRRLLKTVHFPFVGMRIYPGTPLYRRAVSEGLIGAGDDLLHPVFYIARGLTEEKIFSVLSEFSRRSQNWVVGELPPEKVNVIEGLRRKGIPGPLWEFLVR